MPGPMSQSDGKLLRKLPGAYWSQRLRMGWSSKGEIGARHHAVNDAVLGLLLPPVYAFVGSRRRRGGGRLV